MLKLTKKQARAVAEALSHPATSKMLAHVISQALRNLRQERRLTEEKLHRRITI
jgi:hypothetical protein